jgi:hypothetical protein
MALANADRKGVQLGWGIIMDGRYTLYRKVACWTLWPLGTLTSVVVVRTAKTRPRTQAPINMRYEHRTAVAMVRAEMSEEEMTRGLCEQFGEDAKLKWHTKAREEQLAERAYELRSSWTYELVQETQPAEQTKTNGTEEAQMDAWGKRRNDGPTETQGPERKKRATDVKVLMAYAGNAWLQPVPRSMTEAEMVQRLCAHFEASQGK